MSSRGFTLLELLVVLAITTLILTVAVPRFSTGVPGAEIRSAARELVTGLRTARSRAITYNREIAFALDVESRRYTLGDGGPPVDLPADVDVSFVTAQSELLGRTGGVIRFYPDGGATGGRVTLIRGTNRYRIDVDWLTGKISLDETASGA